MSETRIDSPLPAMRRFVGPLARITRWGLVALLLANVSLLIYYIGYGYQAFFHSDAATKNVLAQEMFETGKYFPVDWNYVNGDLMLVFGHVFIVPLLPFFENGYPLHAVSGLISAALVLLATWLVSGVISRSPWTRMLCVAIVASGVSEVMAENLFGQVSYGNVFYMACFTVYFAWRFLHSQGRARWGWGGLLAVISMLLFWANPQRAMASYVLPLLAAAGVYTTVALGRAGLHWNTHSVRGVILVALVLLGAAVGTGLHGWVLAGVNNIPGVGSARWLPFDGMMKNLVNTLHGLLAILGGVPVASRAVISLPGMVEGIRLLAACGLLVLVPIAVARAFKDSNDGVRFVAVFALVSIALFLFLHVTTTIPDMGDPISASRYLVPPLLFSLLILVVTVLDKPAGWVYRVLGGAVLVVMATSAFTSNNPFSHAITGSPADSRKQLIHLLEANGLKYGYATYWNAGALTVLSGQQVRVRQVLLEQGLPTPMRHLSSNRWYRPGAWQGESFLLLRDSEAKSVQWDALTAYAGKPSKILRMDDFGIYVFPRNIAAVMPNWNDELASPLSLRISEASFHQVGSFDASGGPGALVVETGTGGFLHFGPYLKLRTGAYQVIFDVETSGDPSASFGTVDVSSNGGTVTHASRPLARQGRQKVALAFQLDRGVNDLEVRVFSNGMGRIKLHGIEMRPQD